MLRFRLASSRPVRVLAVVAAVLGLAGVHSGPALAHTGSSGATPSRSSEHPWPSNGCGPRNSKLPVPDSVPLVFDFRHACDHHDGCYGGYSDRGTRNWRSRRACDAAFEADMVASCKEQHGARQVSVSPLGRRCLQVARVYWCAVRLAGAPMYAGPSSLNDWVLHCNRSAVAPEQTPR